MIVCPVCNHRNPDDAPVCEACGGSLEHFVYRACPSCGALNPAGNVFCHRCFAELAGNAQPMIEPKDIPVRPFVPPESSTKETEQAVREEPSRTWAWSPSSRQAASNPPALPRA